MDQIIRVRCFLFFPRMVRKFSKKKVKLFLLFVKDKSHPEILEQISQYCDVVKEFKRRREYSQYSQEDAQLRLYGSTLGW